MERVKKTPLKGLKEAAMTDYQQAAIRAKHFNPFIAKAIRAYNPKPKTDIWYKVLVRLIILPIYCLVPLYFCLKMWVKHCYFMTRYGGETLVYLGGEDRATIMDAINELKDFKLKK